MRALGRLALAGMNPSGSPLRVGVVGPVYPDSFADNILSALRAIGTTAFHLGPLRRESPAGVARAFDLVARASVPIDKRWQMRLAVRAEPLELDVVISVQGGLLPSVVARLRSRGAKVCLWFPDSLDALDRGLMLLAPYDAIFFKEPLLIRRLQALLDLPIHYLPEACNPEWHRPCTAYGTQPHVAVVGTLRAQRIRLLERLEADGVPLRLHGAPMPRWASSARLERLPAGGNVYREDKARAFRSAVAALNPINPAEAEGVNCRLFEATGSGAVVLCEDRAAIGDLFERGEEVLTYSSYSELLTHVRWLLEQPSAGADIANAASRRAHGEHTYRHRLTAIFEVLTC